MEPKTLRASVAADYVGLAVSTLKKLRVTRQGPAFEKHGRAVYYRVEDLDAWLERQVTARVPSLSAGRRSS